MNAIAKTIQNANINPRNFGITLIVLMGVVALFLIPEMVGFQSSAPKSAVQAPPPAAESSVTTLPAPAGNEAVAPVESTEPVENEYAALQGANHSADAAGAAPDTATVDPAEQAARDEAGKQLEKAQLTWGDLRSKQTTVIFEKARNDVGFLIQNLKTQQFGHKKATEYALLNFYNALGMILARNAPFMSPDEAVGYLELLDSQVTRAMMKDDVDRAIYAHWVRVSLGNLLSGTTASRLKERYKVPFDPELTAGSVSISQGINKPGEPYASYNNSFRFYGYVHSNDVKKLSVFHDKEFKQDINLTFADQRGIRQFYFAGLPATGIWTFRAYDEFGATYEKSYNFLPRASRFKQDDAGIFQLPFTLPYIGYEGPNKILDRFFLVNVKQHQESGPSGGLGTFSESTGWTTF